ncbi:MAG TPA: NAD(P)-dependent oxidoreductase [Candidatus Binatia bacterium]|nr:NAD(P)-dependent oxidoreductase [Candidatus Binatia bacterium]
MNILITGAGLIGSHCARQAVDAGNQVVLFDLSPNRDYLQKVVGKDRANVVAAGMRDLPALIDAMEHHHIDTVVHTAGLIGSRVAENSYTGATNNILGTINVLEASRLRRLRRVVYVSTFGVYDRPKISDIVIRESDPIGGHNLYTVTKLCSEHLVRSYAAQYKLDTIIIRPSGVFGRGHYVGGSTVGKVMRDLALNVIKGEPFTIDAKTYAPNEYVYGKDVALALFLACRAENPKQRVYNAGTGVVTGPEALAQTVSELAPATEVKVVGSSGVATSKTASLDLSVSKAELGYTPQYPLKEALRNYMEELWEEQRN